MWNRGSERMCKLKYSPLQFVWQNFELFNYPIHDKCVHFALLFAIIPVALEKTKVDAPCH